MLQSQPAGTAAISTQAIILHTLPRLQLRTCLNASALHLSRKVHILRSRVTDCMTVDPKRGLISMESQGIQGIYRRLHVGRLAIRSTSNTMRRAHRLHLPARPAAASRTADSKPQYTHRSACDGPFPRYGDTHDGPSHAAKIKHCKHFGRALRSAANCRNSPHCPFQDFAISSAMRRTVTGSDSSG